jgi:hypothetical protein
VVETTPRLVEPVETNPPRGQFWSTPTVRAPAIPSRDGGGGGHTRDSRQSDT